MSNHRVRLFSSMLVAFLIVSLYGRLSTGPMVTPAQAEKMKNLLSNIKFNPNSVTRLFTLNFSSTSNNGVSGNGVGGGAYVLPTVDQVPPSANSTFQPGLGQISPTGSNITPICTGDCLSPTDTVSQPTGTSQPSNTPKPTKAPKPTSPPAQPPITSDARPGTTLMGIYQEVNKRLCFPAALLAAFQTEETGAWVNINEPSSSVKSYNVYGWWNTGIDPCHGFGFDEATGYASDGTFCMQTPGANPGQMGLFSLNQFEEDAARKYLTSIIPKNLDRRVWFDDALIFAQISINRLSAAPTDCNNWSDAAVNAVAGKHQGSCANNYCSDVLKYYKQYSK